MDGVTEDCYYFLYSTCRRGASCCYRHNSFSKQNPVLCEEWAQTGECRIDCPFRHSTYHLQKRRADDLCYWEDREQGCTKEFCEFKHRDATKDAWKEGGVKNIGQIRREKSARRQLDAAKAAPVDLEAFERERREKKLERRSRLEGTRTDEHEDLKKPPAAAKRPSEGAVNSRACGEDMHKRPRMGAQKEPVHHEKDQPESTAGTGVSGQSLRADRPRIKVDDEKALDDEFEDLDALLDSSR